MVALNLWHSYCLIVPDAISNKESHDINPAYFFFLVFVCVIIPSIKMYECTLMIPCGGPHDTWGVGGDGLGCWWGAWEDGSVREWGMDMQIRKLPK